MQPPLSDCTILLVDDEEANLDLLEAFLLGEGYHSLVRTSDARQALPLFEAHAPDLVLLDLHMPFRSGFEVLSDLLEHTPTGDYLPVLVLTADITSEAKERALSGGARDFLIKPFDAVEVLLRVRNLLETRLLYRTQQDARRRAEALAEENARLFAEAQWATRARDRMLSVVAHDLRNPLALVAMGSEMLLQLQPNEEDSYALRTLSHILQATQRMQRLIEDLLDASRLEHGTFALRLAPVVLDELFQELEATFRPVADGGGIRLEIRGEPDPAPLFADGGRLLQVLSNLLANALKFSPEGGRVEVAWRAEGGALQVAVSDQGPGIPPESLPHVFGAFWQASGAERQGVGLGLWIARSIVEAHGGQIWVDSRPGVGTVFRFSVPWLSKPPAGNSAPLLDPLPTAPA